MWSVEVWFATSTGYRRVFSSAKETEVLREARVYRSDSRGIRIVSPDGDVQQFKAESVM